jgi:hypothetical protein
LLNSTHIGASIRITSRAKNRKDRLLNGRRAKAWGAGVPTQSVSGTAQVETMIALTKERRKSERVSSSA